MATDHSLNIDDVVTIGRRFRLDVRKLRRLEGGMTNSVFVLETMQGDYTLLVFDDHDLARASSLGSLMRRLAARGIPTPPALLDDRAQPAFLLKDRPAVLRPYIAGVVESPLPSNALTSAGALLARIHTEDIADDLPSPTRRIPPGWRERVGTHAETHFVELIGAAEQVFAAIDWSEFPHGLAHGDFFADNLVTVADGCQVIDWEFASYDAVVIDLGIALIGMGLVDGRLWPARMESFLTGYQSVRKMSDEEWEVVPLATRHAAVVLAYRRWVRDNVDHPNALRADRYLELARLADGISATGGVRALPIGRPPPERRRR